jgi:hypothetical protein
VALCDLWRAEAVLKLNLRLRVNVRLRVKVLGLARTSPEGLGPSPMGPSP